MKVIVGSRTLWPTPSLASNILTLMVSTDEHFAVRQTKQGEVSSMTEMMALRIGARINRTVTPWAPMGNTRASTFHRDISMVDSASEVHAFFGPDALMQGGTGHVVYCALRRGVHVHAYEVDVDGNIIETASDEGDLAKLWTEG